jgi:hypothetical protein
LVRRVEFEQKCINYLQAKYANKHITFKHNGGADSTTADIAVYKNGKFAFNIEAKDSRVQSVQFVLIPDDETRTFHFSMENTSESDEFSNAIINVMNQDFNRYRNVGTVWQPIEIPISEVYNSIIDHYKRLNVKYVISYYNGFVIFPLNKIPDYFNIATKASDSQPISLKDEENIMQLLSRMERMDVGAFFRSEGRLKSVQHAPYEDVKFSFSETERYQLCRIEPYVFEVIKLSNTQIINVILSIKLKHDQDNNDLLAFENNLCAWPWWKRSFC